MSCNGNLLFHEIDTNVIRQFFDTKIVASSDKEW